MPKMVEVVIDSVRVSLTGQHRVVVLREVDAERYLPIWIGPYEAESITVAMQEIEYSRPQAHDLLKNMLHALNARLVRIEVVGLREEVFYGNLVIEMNEQLVNVDARPSDSLALAVRAHVPIMVAGDVMDAAGIVPEEDIQNQAEKADPSTEENPIEPTGSDRLSVFEDFLQNIDFDVPPPPEEDKDEPDKGGPEKPEP
jgi:bifunctional DNase/RNase